MGLALLIYEDVRSTDDPRDVVLQFLESAYQAGSRRAGWDTDNFALKPFPEGVAKAKDIQA